MISIKELEKRLPEDALISFKELFPPEHYNKIINSFRTERNSSFRINTLKSNLSEVSELMRKYDAKIKSFDLIKNAYFFYGKINKIMKTELVSAGKIYFQSLSSMIPVIVLDPRENESILDIAAAPGSKTTQIAAITNNKTDITAVEPDYIRMERLKFNADTLSAVNITFFKTHGESFYKRSPEKFDRVLADLPCSGEGRFNYFDKASYGSWRLNEIRKFSTLQKKLLKSAILSAKKGGIIVYSTCTMNLEENEKVIDAMFKEPDFKIEIEEIGVLKEFPEKIKPFLNFKNEFFNPSIKNALRIIPSERFEGFFVCRLKRLD